MKVTIFQQWDKLVSLLTNIAGKAATAKSSYRFNRVVPEGGRAQLADRSMNALAVEGGETVVVVPTLVPDAAREFLLRVTATGENTLSFTGADGFEGESDALDAPADGETVVYFFTETAADVFLVARKVATTIEKE